MHVGLVTATLLLSWLVTHVVFALRYAHEYYATDLGGPGVDGGLDFPGKEPPDYWDFCYFAVVIGMTFQVSDVQITSRKLRRLATGARADRVPVQHRDRCADGEHRCEPAVNASGVEAGPASTPSAGACASRRDSRYWVAATMASQLMRPASRQSSIRALSRRCVSR